MTDEKLRVESQLKRRRNAPRRPVGVRTPRQLLRMKHPKVRIGELYCGPGGLAVAAQHSHFDVKDRRDVFDHVWASDYDADTCRTYEANIARHSPNVTVIHRNVHQLDISSSPRSRRPPYGFPCNDFSLVGETLGLDGEYGLYIGMALNTSTTTTHSSSLLRTSEDSQAPTQVRRLLNLRDELANAGDHGYTLTKHLYKFEEYGVPQARHRIIMVGIRADLKLRFEVPAPTGITTSCREQSKIHPLHRMPITTNSRTSLKSKSDCLTSNQVKMHGI